MCLLNIRPREFGPFAELLFLESKQPRRLHAIIELRAGLFQLSVFIEDEELHYMALDISPTTE